MAFFFTVYLKYKQIAMKIKVCNGVEVNVTVLKISNGVENFLYTSALHAATTVQYVHRFL